jgi:hypothetical protein
VQRVVIARQTLGAYQAETVQAGPNSPKPQGGN